MNEAAVQFSLAAGGESQQLEGSVVLSVNQLDAAFRLPKIIAALRHEEPLINIEVIVTNEPSDLLRREADIAIRNFHPIQNDLIAKNSEKRQSGCTERLHTMNNYPHHQIPPILTLRK